MLFTEKTRIEEYIIELLDQGTFTGPELLALIHKTKPAITKQGLYKSLRQLFKDEVISKTGTQYSLNRIWLRKIHSFVERHMQDISIVDAGHILDFENGDTVTYRFKSPYLLDIVWGHLYDILYEVNPAHLPSLNYHPHEWLRISRPETEKYWLNRFDADKKMMLFSIGGSSPLDKDFQKNWSSEYVKINTGESYGLKPNQYLSIVGDYVFEVTTDLAFEKQIDDFFMAHKKLDETTEKEIGGLSRMKYQSKLKLTKNKKKADLWRKRFAKHFFIPEHYRQNI